MFLSPMEAGVTEAASVIVRPGVEVFIDGLHSCDSSMPEGVSTSFTVAKGANCASGVEL